MLSGVTAITLLVMALVGFVPVWACLTLFVLRSTRQPLKPRVPWTVVCTTVSLTLWMVFLLLQRVYVDTYPCWLYILTGNVLLVWCIDFFCLRVWMFFVAHKLMQEKLAIHAGMPATDAKWHARRHLVQKRVLIPSLAVLWILQAVAAVVVIAMHESVRDGTETVDDCEHVLPSNINTMLWMCILAAFCLYTAWALKGVVEDAWGIKRELRMCAIIALCGALPWFATLQIGAIEDWQQENWRFSSMIAMLTVLVELFVVVVWPVRMSFRRHFSVTVEASQEACPLLEELGEVQDDKQETTLTISSSLSGLLSCEEGRKAFYLHLEKEFSVENLMFLENATAFRKRSRPTEEGQPPDTASLACALYNKFVSPRSPLQVNLSTPTRSGIEDILAPLVTGGLDALRNRDVVPLSTAQLPAKLWTVFDRAIENVYQLLAQDSYSRFLDTKEYTEVIRSTKATAGKNEVLQLLEFK